MMTGDTSSPILKQGFKMEQTTRKSSSRIASAGPLLAGAVLIAIGLILLIQAGRVESEHLRQRANEYQNAVMINTEDSTAPILDEVTRQADETPPDPTSNNPSPIQALTALWSAESRQAAAGYRAGAYACWIAGGMLLIAAAVRWGTRPLQTAIAGAEGVRAKLTEHSALLDSINERMLISDAAKRVVFRAKDREALRQAIREDIDRNDYDAALVLVEEMSDKYGYREEAEVFREEILATREAAIDEKLSNAIRTLDGYLDRYDWQRAMQEAAKIRRLFPDHPRAAGIERRVREARALHKHDLERQFLDAAQRDDVDRAWELMKELDEHMTEADAEPFREIARGVIGKKRENLGVQFKLAVHDRDWIAAVDVGEQIIRDFPNTKMASEVRGMLDLLRERAAGQRAARA